MYVDRHRSKQLLEIQQITENKYITEFRRENEREK